LEKNLSVDEIFDFITKDFEGVWNSVVKNNDENIGKGNFIFGRQAMSLIEFVCRLCFNDTTGKEIKKISHNLNRIQPKYFTILPGKCVSTADFSLLTIDESQNDPLLWSLFDLIRHGLSHQYQQIIANLNDEKQFYVKLTGSTFDCYLNKSRSLCNNHLAYSIDSDGDLELTVYPDILYLDFKDAIYDSGILKTNLQFNYLSRPNVNKKKQKKNIHNFYNFSIKDLERSLVKGGHIKI
jgi:hypothetical protein